MLVRTLCAAIHTLNLISISVGQLTSIVCLCAKVVYNYNHNTKPQASEIEGRAAPGTKLRTSASNK